MAKEILVVSEDYLLEVIAVIRAGLDALAVVSDRTRIQLVKWCDEEEEYVKRLGGYDNAYYDKAGIKFRGDDDG